MSGHGSRCVGRTFYCDDFYICVCVCMCEAGSSAKSEKHVISMWLTYTLKGLVWRVTECVRIEVWS